MEDFVVKSEYLLYLKNLSLIPNLAKVAGKSSIG